MAFGFSWKRFFGITKMNRKISKTTGIPLTKAGRKNKMQRTLWKLITGKK